MRSRKVNIALMVVCGYLLLVMTIDAFTNPDLTNTERFLRIGNALCWDFSR